MKKMLLSLLASTIYTSAVSAQTCQQPPSCESLGYTKSVDDCGDIKYLTCPFDSSKVYCLEVGETCDFIEYPLTECPTGGNCTKFECKETIQHIQYKLDSCQSGYTKSGNSCCNFSSYPLASCPTGGNCTEYECDGTTKYKLRNCKTGYVKKGNICISCDSIEYRHTSCPSNGNCSYITCNGTTKYKLDSCKTGYRKEGYNCDDECVPSTGWELPCINEI
ncbi:MAG: hypothetical protein E7012_06845 [Alphaproteobacteria bacterium]|nr:hypothetical protein [Alphaproteobacteria bacterium]